MAVNLTTIYMYFLGDFQYGYLVPNREFKKVYNAKIRLKSISKFTWCKTSIT